MFEENQRSDLEKTLNNKDSLLKRKSHKRNAEHNRFDRCKAKRDCRERANCKLLSVGHIDLIFNAFARLVHARGCPLTSNVGGVDESERHAVVDIERANVKNKIAR